MPGCHADHFHQHSALFWKEVLLMAVTCLLDGSSRAQEPLMLDTLLAPPLPACDWEAALWTAFHFSPAVARHQVLINGLGSKILLIISDCLVKHWMFSYEFCFVHTLWGSCALQVRYSKIFYFLKFFLQQFFVSIVLYLSSLTIVTCSTSPHLNKLYAIIKVMQFTFYTYVCSCGKNKSWDPEITCVNRLLNQ